MVNKHRLEKKILNIMSNLLDAYKCQIIGNSPKELAPATHSQSQIEIDEENKPDRACRSRDRIRLFYYFVNLHLCIAYSPLVEIVMLLFCMVCLIQIIFCMSDCILPNTKPHQAGDTTKSETVLIQLQPLQGKIFTASLTENNDDTYEYSLAICSGITTYPQISDFANVGAIQVDTAEQEETKKYKVLGKINNSTVKGGTDWVLLTYRGGDAYGSHCRPPNADSSFVSRRQTHIMIICDPQETQGSLKVLYEEREASTELDCFYLFELSTNAVCNSKTNGLSSGSIFLIVFFSIAATYLIVGMAYKRFVHGTKGIEQIPNIGFWKSFGSLQADGCDFLCRCQESGFSNSNPYRGVADDQLGEEGDDENLLPM